MADKNKNGIYCSTSGTIFTEKKAFTEHYKSDFHLYNLKRKIAGLQPVTKEWFDARKQHISASHLSKKDQPKYWIDPVTKKSFQHENTYKNLINSNKYQILLKKEGYKEAPKPKLLYQRDINEKQGEETYTTCASDFKLDKEAWPLEKSFFDNHLSSNFEDNLEYMYKKYGFYFPDVEHLKDPKGLFKYLGCKLEKGHIPLYESGMNPEAKRFKTLSAVQNHMIDKKKFFMYYEDNEDEYEDYYDLDYLYDSDLSEEEEEEEDLKGCELIVIDAETGKEKIIGAREYARYYKQRHRKIEVRESVLVNQMVAKYRNMGLITKSKLSDAELRAKRQEKRQMDRIRLKTALRTNVNNNLPRNVPY